MMADPRVLYIDDDPKPSAGLFRRAVRNLKIIDTTLKDDRASFEAEVEKADLVVSDFMLAESLRSSPDSNEKFPEYPRDGQALNEVVRSLRRENPPVVAIYSAKLDKIPGDQGGLPHLRARSLNAAFVGDKAEPSEFETRLRVAVSALKAMKPSGTTLRQRTLERLLRLPGDTEWHAEAIRQFELSRPPLREVGGQTGIRPSDVFDWMLHKVLPYPGLLIDIQHLALAMRIDPAWLERKFENDPDFVRTSPIGRLAYRGILSGFFGPRWWTSGVDDLIWKRTKGKRDSVNLLRDTVRRWFGRGIRFLPQRSPVLLSDEFGALTGRVAEATEAIRIMPIGWPPGSPWPWVAVAEVKKDPLLKALAVPDDLTAAGLA